MLQGADPAQREKALEIIRDIVSEADGTATAKEAREILEKQERPRREEERDPVLEAYSRRWSGVQGLTDPNIVRLLRELKGQPGVAVRLRSNAVRDIRKWIELVLPRIPDGLSRQEIDTLNGFVAEVSQIDAYRVDEIVPLRRSLFLLRYQELRQQIDEALDRWAMEEAWRLHAELTPAPEEFKADVLHIQKRIYQVEQLRQSVEESLAQLSRKMPETWPETWPATWLDLRMLVSSLGNSEGYLAGNRLPAGWRERVEEAIDGGTLAARAFLERQASLAVDPAGLREFQARHRELELAGIGDRLAASEDWFRNALNSIEKHARAEVAGAASVEELKAVARKLGERSDGLPEAVADRMRNLAGQVNVVAANWLGMIYGDEFDASTQEGLPAPEGFLKAAPEYRAQLDEINQASAAIKADAAPAEEDYRESLRVAEKVLARREGHNSALKLKREAERGILCWRLDEALRGWRIEEFLAATQAERAEGVYRDLALNHAVLRELAELAGLEEFQGWRDAADWWTEWREKKKHLPQPESDWPDSLKLAARRQEERRRDQWHGALASLIEADLAPEEAQQAAESLKRELQALSLQGYYQTLMRKAAVARAHRHIDDGQFEKAAAEIAALDEYHEETLRLRTRLNVEEARARSVGETADALFREWQNIARYLPNAHQVLLDTVRQAWETEEAESLKNLRMVLDRAVAGGGAGADQTPQLREWAEWLKVEQAIRAGQSLESVAQMADYLRRAEARDRPAYKQRLERLARFWRAGGNTVMLAWAYQAFNRFDPSLMPSPRDPVEDLIAEGAAIAKRSLDAMRSLEAGGDPVESAGNSGGARRLREEVRRLSAGLREHQGKWRELDNYLDLLHYEELRGKPSPDFIAVQQLSESLLKALDDLDGLRDADWRRDETLETFDAVRRTMMSQFGEFALQPGILARIDHWDPLTRLRFLEARLAEAAELCDSDSQIEIYEERHFANVRRWVGELIEVLTTTGADSWKMWQIASADYCELVYNKAGILMPGIQPPDLHELAKCVDRLMKEELEFKRKIEELSEQRPNVPARGSFDPQRHRDYLERFPKQPPGSRKVYRRFDRFAMGGPMQTILKQSRAYLPDWVRKYLDEGLP
jgi:hypothetical protein